MWRMAMSVMVSGWVLTTPALWAHRQEQAVVAVLVGLVGLLLAPAVMVWPRRRSAVFALGAVLALSAFVFPDGGATTVNHLVSGLLLAIGGMFPEVVTLAPVAMAAPAKPRERVEYTKIAA
jgi:hypothetical protein